MVYYRKYRPQKIADLDSANVRERLIAALSCENVPHAFLFTGPKGLGKTSTARIVAKAVNCEARNVILSDGEGSIKKGRDSSVKPQNDKGNLVEPCNKCDQCKSIINGTNLDVLEIDGASNRGIDEIRDLQEKIGLSPFGSKKKIYIIDEVHMLTTEAFNALLKTLEEPPSHALFILCTTELHKVPATIVSRCFQISFSRATAEELVRSFRRVLQGESLEADDEALLEIAKLSDGSFRDGAKALEEIVTIANGKKITKELVEEKFQISNIQLQISNLLSCLQKKDAKSGLKIIEHATQQGIDMKYFVETLLNTLHGELLVQVGLENSEPKIEEIKRLVELLSKAYQEIKYAVLPQLPLELVIVEYALSGSMPVTVVEEKKDNRDFWFAFLDAVKKESHTIAGVLRGCHLVRYDNTEVVIETRHSFHKNRLEERPTREILEKALKEATGKDVKVLVALKVGD